MTRLNDSCFARAHGLRRDKYVNNFYMLSEYSSAQKESVGTREKNQDWYTESPRKEVFQRLHKISLAAQR